MKFSYPLSLTVASILSSALAFQPEPVFENSQVTRLIDTTGTYIRETVQLKVKNIGDSPVEDYYYAVSPSISNAVSVIEGREKTKQKVLGIPVALHEELDEETGAVYYKVGLSKALEPGSETSIELGIAYLNRVSPSPEFGTQHDTQTFLITDSVYTYSAYPSADQKLKIATVGLLVEDLTYDGETKKEGAHLVYGPFEDVAPYSSEELMLKYENPKPMIKGAKLQRDIWVSHWGSTLSFEETYQLQNAGTKLKDNSFSRLEYNRRSSKYNLNIAALRNIDIKLPPFAREPFFTDLVGNVSTSNFRQSVSESLLQLRPRFPVFGGWNYNFTIGWSADLKHFTKLVGPDQYLLKVPLLEGPVDIAYDNVTVNIILPEGAKQVDVAALEPSSPEVLKVVYSYLDFFGRPAIELNYNSLIDSHRLSEVYVSYTLTTADSLRKAAAISALITAFFTLILFLGKQNLSITSTKQK